MKLSRSALFCPLLLWKQKPVLPPCYPWRYRKDYLTLGLKPRKLICLQSQATDVFLLPSASALRLISQLTSGSIGERGIVFWSKGWCGSELNLPRTLPNVSTDLRGSCQHSPTILFILKVLMSLLCRNLMCRWSPSLSWPSSNSSSEAGEILAFPQLPPPHQQARSRLGGEAFDLDRDPPWGPFKFHNWTFHLPHPHLVFKANASACSHLIWEFRPSREKKPMNRFSPCVSARSSWDRFIRENRYINVCSWNAYGKLLS